jgi:hypothetical protein
MILASDSVHHVGDLWRAESLVCHARSGEKIAAPRSRANSVSRPHTEDCPGTILPLIYISLDISTLDNLTIIPYSKQPSAHTTHTFH